MDIDELNKLIDDTQEQGPAKTTLGILQYVSTHKAHVIKEFGKYIKYFEDYFDVLNTAISTLNYVDKKEWPPYKSLQFILFPETMKTLHRAFEDAIDGYYDESIILLRSVYETYIRMLFIVIYPEDYMAIFKSETGKRVFNLTNFIEHDLKLDWRFLYETMSFVAHSKVHKNLKRLVEVSQRKFKGEIRLEYEYDEDAFSRPMNISSFLLYLLFHLMLVTFKEDYDKSSIDSKHITKINNIDKALKGIISFFPNDFSNIINDIEKIDILIAEKGKQKNK